MSKQALLNINLLAARKGAAELEFAVKKVHSLDSSKGTPDGYIKAIEKRVEELSAITLRRTWTQIGLELGYDTNILNVSSGRSKNLGTKTVPRFLYIC